MSNPWNERYSQTEYVYGETPNSFFTEQLDQLKPGTLLLPCEGEGRNAVYAVRQGWNVMAYDSSEVGKNKAMQLAAKHSVAFDYQIDDATTINFPENSMDVIAFIYAHFPPAIRQTIHRNAIAWLKPGGKIILEAFNLLQRHNTSGGPKDPTMLYSVLMLKEDFAGLDIELLQTKEVNLNEGKYHEGKADVIRMVAVKKQCL